MRNPVTELSHHVKAYPVRYTGVNTWGSVKSQKPSASMKHVNLSVYQVSNSLPISYRCISLEDPGCVLPADYSLGHTVKYYLFLHFWSSSGLT